VGTRGPAGLVALAVVFAVLGVLYALGAISFLTTHPTGSHHYQHAVVLAVLCLASLVAAALARPRRTA
jgi:hypothetical protein